MTSKLGYLTKLSLKKKIATKWFVIANIILFIIIAAIINIDLIIKSFGGDFDEKTEVLIIDNANCYNDFSNTFTQVNTYLDTLSNIEIKKYNEKKEAAYEEIKKEDKILLVINESKEKFLDIEMVTKSNIDTVTYQAIISILNDVKKNIAIKHYGISNEILADISSPVQITRTKLDENKDVSEMMELVMGTVFPIVILPFFMLTMFLVQMIGAEINEEKTTRGMEIIISNVSPKTHFFSKILSGNIFVLLQAFMLLLYVVLGIIIRVIITGSLFNLSSLVSGSIGGYVNEVMASLELTGVLSQLSSIIPITLLLMLLTFIAYSLLAGILASMTTNMEDYQQVQTPIIIVSLIGYYLSIMAAMFEGSVFIKILSYVPFISSLLSPALLVLGQITIIDALISLSLVIILIWILFKYGLKIYKVGILNYSSTNLWKKMFKAIKS